MVWRSQTSEQKRRAQFTYKLRSGKILSPSADSIVGNYKEPLRKYEDGFGYLGALVYDKDELFTQCHICGYFYKFLGSHVRQNHTMSSSEYKDMFMLNRKTSLLATNTRTSFIKSSHFANWTIEERAAHNKFLKLGEKKRVAKLVSSNRAGNNRKFKTLEQKNIEGKCPDQLLDKLEKLSESLGRTPKRREFIKEYGHGFNMALRTTFGSYGEAIKILNLSPNKPGSERYTKDMLIEILKDFYNRYERVPMTCDIRTFKLPSLDTFRKHFGTFTEAKIQAIGKYKDER